jgi:dethiobiotin synthetase
MSIDFPQHMFITGTDTDIGKTLVSALLLAGLEGHYWKPIQTGVASSTNTDDSYYELGDTAWVVQHAGVPIDRTHPPTHQFPLPLSPHAAAQFANTAVSLSDFDLPTIPQDRTLVVEGAGGVMVPLNDDHYMLDLIKRLAIPVIIVARSGLGTINHTLLTLTQLRAHEVPVFGVILNGVKNPGNKHSIEKFGEVRVIGEIEPMRTITPSSLRQCFRETFR